MAPRANRAARTRFLSVVAALLVGGTVPVAATQLFKGWWVVVGTFPAEPYQRQAEDSDRISAAARRCGVRTFNDFSSKFKGFAPGRGGDLNVFVIGAFASKARASSVANSVRRCFPDAYVKYGEHLGE